MAAHVNVILSNEGGRVGAYSASSPASRSIRILGVAIQKILSSHIEILKEVRSLVEGRVFTGEGVLRDKLGGEVSVAHKASAYFC